MGIEKSKQWTKKELDEFQSIILNKREIVLEELAEAKEKADKVLNNNHQLLDTSIIIYSRKKYLKLHWNLL